MTNPGEDAGQTASSDSSGGASEPSSGGYEAPSIEQSQEQPGQPEAPQPAEQPGYTPPPAYTPPPGYEAPSYPQQQGYPPQLSAARLHAADGVSGARRRATRLPAAPLPRAARLRRAVVPAAAIRDTAYGTPPPPGYGPPPTGYPAPEYSAYGQPAQKTNSMAIASLVASCIGFLCGSARSPGSCSALSH